MKFYKVIWNCFTAALIISPFFCQAQEQQFVSPDKNIQFSITNNKGALTYNITYNHKSVIDTSPLDIVVNDKTLGDITSFGKTETVNVSQSYNWRGFHSKVEDRVPIHRLLINSKNNQPFYIESRVFNDGVAFRYVILNQTSAIVNADNTGFAIPKGSTVWSQNNVKVYEGKYLEQKIEDIKPGQLAGPPLTFKLASGSVYAAITEGGLTDFAGMSLIAADKNTFKANLTGTVSKQGAIETPWRIIEIGKDLNTLVNCDIIHNVSPPADPRLFPDGAKTSWIKPGRSAWSYLAGNGEITFENMKRYSDWAGELGFEYNLVDEKWMGWNDGGKNCWTLLKELTSYAETKNVKTWVWKAYPNRRGIKGLKNADDRLAFLKKCKEAGVAGVKIDFLDSESQEVIDFYQAALKEAAELHLMIDFHGANKPTGESRTWPNEMSREAIRGLEHPTTSWPKFDATLPFTRFLAGHADYTPLSFRDVIKGITLTHQVATVAIFNSPFMCLAVNPEALLTHPARKIICAIPVDWDETIVLPQSKIGELVLMAKRKGTKWFLVSLNGEEATHVKINLSFLGKGDYLATTMEDAETDMTTARIKEGVKFNEKSKLDITMPAGGGFVGMFTKRN